MSKKVAFTIAAALCGLVAMPAQASNDCRGLPDHEAVRDALRLAVHAENGGLGFNMWASIVNRDGAVCVVAFSGADRGDQWPGSRVISAQKANTANAFSLPDFALSSANLWAATQPGGSLFGLQFSNPVDTAVAYGRPGTDRNPQRARFYGTPRDPLVGTLIGGVNVFGGGLGLYNADGELLGGLGVSGDTSCADHNIAWRLRGALELDNVPAGVAGAEADNIIYDVTTDPVTGLGVSAGGFGHPSCGGNEETQNAAILDSCPPGGGSAPDCLF